MTLYETDFYAWTQEQAQLLRTLTFPQIDAEHLSEEIESMGRAERRQLVNRLEILLVHLLKWQYQPELRGRSWELTIAEQRRRIARLLRDNPSLRSYLFAAFVDAYEDAGFSVVRETGLPQTTFPDTCPYTLDQVLDDPWLPE